MTGVQTCALPICVLELRQGCNGASRELQWSFTGAVGAALVRRRGCNGASPDADGAAMRATMKLLSESIIVAMKLRHVGAAMALLQSYGHQRTDLAVG